MAVDAVTLDLDVESVDEIAVVLHRFAARDDERRANEPGGARFVREVSRDFVGQLGERADDVLIDDEDRFRITPRAFG